eukprot:4940937-Amphidinium_carterae.1
MQQAGDGEGLDAQAVHPRHFPCPQCDKVCASRAGLANHARKIHGITDSIVKKVSGNTCLVCNGIYASRLMLISHLRENVSPICRARYRTLPDLEKHVNAIQPEIRESYVRRGRKRRQHGRPVSEKVIPLMPD